MTPSVGENSIRAHPCPNCCVCNGQGQLLYAGLQDRLYCAPGRWNLKKCPNPHCGLIWLDPMPIEGDIGKAYAQYFTHGTPDGGQSLQRRFRLRSLLKRISPVQRFYTFIKRGYLATAFGYTAGISRSQRLCGYALYLSPFQVHMVAQGIRYADYCPGGRLLDVGCGSGSYVAYMRTLRWEVEGVEVDPRAVEQARKLNLVIYQGNLEERGFENNRFDMITLSHVLEHVHKPLAVLKECCRILKPGAFLVVVTPNTESIGHAWFRESWHNLDPPRHIHLFTPAALKRLAVEAGFHVEMQTSAVDAEGVYAQSTLIAQNRNMTTLPSRLSVFIKRRAFALYECFIMLAGKDSAEEIHLKGCKQ